MDSKEDIPEQPSEWLISEAAAVLRSGKLSYGLLVQLERFWKTGTFDVSSILSVVGQIESLGEDLEASRIARPFKHLPLKGLWHAHHIQSRFMLHNIVHETKRFDFEAFFRPYLGQVFTAETAKELARETVVSSYRRCLSEGRATGEWIVFERDNGFNWYLTLAEHDEDDQVIYDRVQAHKTLGYLAGSTLRAI